MHYETARDIYKIIKELEVLSHKILTTPGAENFTDEDRIKLLQAQISCDSAVNTLFEILNKPV